jgi:hypothetical protein
MNKILLAAAVLSVASVGMTDAASAGISRFPTIDYPCYMIDQTGAILNLSAMCPRIGVNAVTATSSQISTFHNALSGTALQEALDTAAVVYADAFCEARAREGTRRESGSAATSALASYMVSEGISSDNLTTDFFAEAQEISAQLCPELQPTGQYD